MLAVLCGETGDAALEVCEELGALDVALCRFARKLTREPSSMQEEDVVALRAVGLDDVGIHDAIQVVAYFNYINRVADAAHVDPEPDMAPYA